MSQSPPRGPTVFDEATLQFFRVPPTEIEYEEEPNKQQQPHQNGEAVSAPRGKVRSLKKNLDLLSLVACRRQGVVPQQLGLPAAASSSHQGADPSLGASSGSSGSKSAAAAAAVAANMTWAQKQHRLGLLRVLTLERSRVVSELIEVLKRGSEAADPHARQRLEHEIRMVKNEVCDKKGGNNSTRRKKEEGGGDEGESASSENNNNNGNGDDQQPFFVADPDEAELIAELLSSHDSTATTAAIQQRLIAAVKRRSEKAVARMYRQHERIIHTEEEMHTKRVELLAYLKERDAVREKQQREQKEQLKQRAASAAAAREEKMATLRLRFNILSNERKEQLERKMRASEIKYEAAQQKQIGHLVERCEAETEKICKVQSRVAKAKVYESQRRDQMEAERRERFLLQEERRQAMELNRDFRLEKRKQRHELLQIRAQNAREQRQEQLRTNFDAAHENQVVPTHEAIKLAHSNQGIIAKRRRSTSNDNNTPAGSRPVSKQSSRAAGAGVANPADGGAGAGENNDPLNTSQQQQQQQQRAKTAEERRQREREEVLRRAREQRVMEQRERELLEERAIQAEAARRVRIREEELKVMHNRENLLRKERADQHRQQLQKTLVEEQEAAAAQRERERRKAEKRLQMLKLDLQRQRGEAQQRIRELEVKAHLSSPPHSGDPDPLPESLVKETASYKARKAAVAAERAVAHAPNSSAAGGGQDPDGDNNSGRPARANAQNSAILATIGDRGKKRAQW